MLIKRFIIFIFIFYCSFLSASEHDHQYKKKSRNALPLAIIVLIAGITTLTTVKIIKHGIDSNLKDKLEPPQETPSDLKEEAISTHKESGGQNNDDPFNLNRFIQAQYEGPMNHPDALKELQNGKKTGHWIWPNLPQINGLLDNPSETNVFYSIKSEAEALAYLSHKKLGSHLKKKAEAILNFNDPIKNLMGHDNVKLRSSMTLFAAIHPKVLPLEENIYDQVLVKHFNNRGDKKTLEILNKKTGLPSKK